jgi:hypothetical protein
MFKKLLVEFIQATAFAACLAFITCIIGLDNNEQILIFLLLAITVGGIPVMLAKRFILSFRSQ